MSRFRTIVNIPVSRVKINYHTPCMFMGSCFADNIGTRMASHKFPVLLNPFGTLFNPVSISNNMNTLMKAQSFSLNDLHQHNGLWFSFSHYTGFAHSHQDACLAAINRSMSLATGWLKQCDFLMLTFGTARVFGLKETGITVANCHKLPSGSFMPRLAEPAEIVSQFDAVLRNLKQFNPGVNVIFTVSPVRHWSDGAVNNQLSKSILHYSIHEILKRHAGTYYFPAYEIFMDELRDYRFYAADMLHPSEQGSQYIWERFSETWLDDLSKKIMAGVAAVLKAVGHRPSRSESTNHKKFKQNTLKQIELLTGMYPFLDFTNEIAGLQLHSE